MKRTDLVEKIDLCAMFRMSEQTITKRIGEMESLIGERYPRQAVVRDERTLLINAVAFADFMAHRSILMFKNGRKVAPPFDYDETKKYLGLEGGCEHGK